MATKPEQNRSNEHKNVPKEQAQKEQPSSREMAPSPQRGRMVSSSGYEPFSRLREEFDRLFDQLAPGFLSPGEGGGQGRHWGLDVQEEDNRVVVRAEAPGFEPSDFDIHVRGDRLVLRASHKSESEEKEGGYHQWQQQELYRSVTLPSDVEADKVEATYRSGVLSISMPRSEHNKRQRIEVKT